MRRKAIIFGLKGYKLSKPQISLLKKTKPWGVILFSRNIKNILQLKKFVSDIKKVFNDKKYPILIDQEGGKVSRLNKIIDLRIFSQNYFGQFYKKDKKNFYRHYKIYIDSTCGILKDLGININTAPVLDIKRKGSHEIIGSRSFSEKTNDVIKLGNTCIKLHHKNKIASVIKHIPGHGLSKYDSHLVTPIINTKKVNLIKKDFKPFKFCNSLFGMTAHIIYTAYDKNFTATHSKHIIDHVVRKHMKFKGLLISDDISMKSLKFNLETNAIKALNAGCNLILHCNGNMREMYKLAKVIPFINNFIKKKTSHFYKFLG